MIWTLMNFTDKSSY